SRTLLCLGRRVRAARAGRLRVAAQGGEGAGVAQPQLLALEGVTKRFGGLTAVSDVSFAVAPGDLVGIIGPNGAGKTTLFNVISGYYRADRGRVVFAGQDVVGQPPHVICRMGLTRTFQLVKPFGNLSVVDNVIIGALTRLQTLRAARVEAESVIETSST